MIGSNRPAHKSSTAFLMALVLSSTALTSVALTTGASANDLPSGATVTAGSVDIQSQADGLLINQATQNAIINWHDFSVGRDRSVHFNNGSGATLNRVTGPHISRIDGSLSATGSLYLVNQHGIVIGKDGVVKTGGSFVASTLDISNEDFLDGGNLTFKGDANTKIINQGKVGSLGGDVAFISRHIVNEGSISAPNGSVGLAVGREVLLQDAELDDGKFLVKVGDADSSITEAGVIDAASVELRAHGGNIYALAGNKGDAINASGTSRSGGRIFLTAGGGKVSVKKTLRAKSRRVRTASKSRSSIYINADVVNLAGLLDVSNEDGLGGKIDVGGNVISLTGATLNADGSQGGGDIRVGGAYQGGDFGDLTTATMLSVDDQTLLTASATDAGDGGDIVLWSDELTSFAGRIEAKGKKDGKGGDAEVSGKAKLAYLGFADLTSESGVFGTLLLDPYNVTLSNEPAFNSAGLAATGDDSNINITTLQTQLASANVTITTNGAGTQSGDILVADDITWDADTTLTLNADRNIGFFANVKATGTNAGLALNHGASGDYIIADGASIDLTGANASFSVNGQSYELIHSMAELDNIDTTGLGGRYALATDLNASGTTYTEALVGHDYANPFSGIFTGLGNTISNLDINSSANLTGLFGRVTRGFGIDVPIRDISLEGGTIRGTDNVGGLIGWLERGIVANAHSNVTVVASGSSAGGLIGNNRDGQIDNSSASGDVTGDRRVGGLVGEDSSRFDITNSFATGNVNATRYSAGGLVGQLTGSNDLFNVYATGNVTGAEVVGGLVGYSFGSTINKAYATGNVTGTDNVGGFIGQIYSVFSGANFSDIYASGRVTGSTSTGALVGNLNSVSNGSISSTISNAYFDIGTTGLTNAVGTTVGTHSVSTTGLTTSQARDSSNYTAFDFTNDWYQNADMRPILRAEIGPTINGVTAVSNLNQLALMGSNLSGNYVLTKDIDASATDGSNPSGIWSPSGWVPVGNSYATRFTGSLDGNGHSISNLTIDRPSTRWVGLFGWATGSFSDLDLINVSIEGDDETGALAGRSEGNTSSARVTGSVTGGNDVGGLIGENYGDIDKSSMTGTVSGVFYVGGLMGYNTSGAITNSHSSGTVRGSFTVGGLIGRNSLGSLDNTYSSATVSGIGSVAGLVADNVNSGSISNSYATGNVTASNTVALGATTHVRAGGLVASNLANATITDSYATGDVTVREIPSHFTRNRKVSAGGLVGGNWSTITNSSATGDVDVSSISDGSVEIYAGGFVGTNGLEGVSYAQGTIKVAYASGSVIGRAETSSSDPADEAISTVGGFAGQNVSLIEDAYVVATSSASATASVTTGTQSFSNAGGFVGENAGTINRTYALGTATAVGQNTNAGQLAGINRGTISNSFSATGATVVADNTGTLTDLNQYSGAQLQDTDLVMNTQSALGWDFNNVWSPPGAGYNPELYAINPVIWVQGATTTSTYGQPTGTVSSIFQHGGVGTYVFGPMPDSMDLTGSTVAVDPTVSAGTHRGNLVTQNVFENSDQGQNFRVFYHGSAAVEVAKADLTITASNDSKTYGTLAPLTNFTTSGLVNSDGVTGLSLTSTGAPVSATVGDYDILASNATGMGLDNYNITYVNGTLTVAKAPLAIYVDNASKTYGNAAAPFSYTASGLVAANGDNITSLDLASLGAPATADAGTYAITADNAAGNGLGNYDISYVNGTLTVNKAPLTITASNASKTYGTAAAPFSYTQSGLVNSDSITSVSLASLGAPATANAGTYAITADNALGTGLGNYNISYVDGTLTVNKAPLTITANDASKTYGNAAAPFGYTSSGLVNSDSISSVNLASLGAPATANAGTYAITADNAAGTGLGNYDINYVNGTLTVNKANLTVTASNDSKTYGTLASLTGFTTSGLVNSDSVTGLSLTSTGTPVSATVGTYDIVANNATGMGLDNYNINYVDGTLTVAKAPLTIYASNDSKTYGTLANLTGYTSSGLVTANGDNITSVDLTSNGSPVSANVSTYYIDASNAQGNGLGNYDISYVQGFLAVNPADLTITADNASKTYGSVFTPTGYTVNGLVTANGDSITSLDLSTTGSAARADVGSYDIVASNAQGTGLSFDGVSNYNITYVKGNLDVTKKPLTITGSNVTKTYGDTAANLGNLSHPGLVAGDSLSYTLSSNGQINNANVGTYDIDAALSGTSGLGNNPLSHNYDITLQKGQLTVNPRAITVTALGGNSIYGDVPTNPGLGATNLASFDSVSALTGLSNSFGISGTTNAGTYTTQVAGTLSNNNYTITQRVDGTWTVNRRPIYIFPHDQSRQYGAANPTLTYDVGWRGLVNGDVLNGSLDTPANVSSPVGQYAITAGTLTNANNPNYDISVESYGSNEQPVFLHVTPAPLTITASDATKYLGQYFQPTSYTVAGLLNMDSVDALTLFSSGSPTSAAIGNYDIVPSQASGQGLSNYSITYVNGRLTVQDAPGEVDTPRITMTSILPITACQDRFDKDGVVLNEDGTFARLQHIDCETDMAFDEVPKFN
ncbi:MBG domain-containing protein [Cohaesibacter gelatinilyticus]|uniref:Filamentous hemagglutinin family N-terminal domain-containing protein n=1 Tax=Cohaesibacter gelatinilyticus TaxID=372072 RepID=A0A285PGE4_9HYPH|nr:MBG domain-containing protein [Cohaesibacter gelatinilyticus]SNZ19216.1 filamentous hemagglutinin family N-terminal domain-containing protein [Cohaesibacter gelatinilyticus]